ncbi:hypothetical protein EDEG_03600 [Edhazardia aedis USNM 41457]|uniref:Uncharacterized protein n=1 Tax=Edhazardia aedis (strain USNM 41457) TaxID=1003232 RepID=J9DKL6_EDHAE|nr:hypothetical protein EDEG_03600 [Edhazardia aedis USNM 41457]|eukprot:EJW01932.1 hypothetical protein EDEG_03600 [Edhazardia aedis USNM 41457]
MTTKSIDTSLQSLNDYDSDAFNQYTTTKSLKCQKETDIYNKSKKLDVYAYKFFIWFIKRIFLVGFIYIVLDFEDLFLKRKEVRNIDTYWDSFKAFLCIFCAIYFVNLINKEKKAKNLKKI